MAYRYRRRRSNSYYASQHISQRNLLTRQFSGIDKDIEQKFLSLTKSQLEIALSNYGSKYGSSAESYARKAYPKWASGAVNMSGQTASRLLDMVPTFLSQNERFELIKKLRSAQFPRQTFTIQSNPESWKQDLQGPIKELVTKSSSFSLSKTILSKADWLTNGDSSAAQKLLSAAEEEEARVRISYLSAEMARIEQLLGNLDAHRDIVQTIELPQGTINLRISMPRKSLLQRLSDWLR